MDIHKYYKKKRNQGANYLGLSKDEAYVIDTTIQCLCFFNPKISPSYFDIERRTDELFLNDRDSFGRFFGALVKEFDCLSVIKKYEIPKGVEFERFPHFIDIIEFFNEKYIMTKN